MKISKLFRKNFSILLMATILCSCSSENKHSSNQDEAALKANIETYEKAFNHKDFAKVSSLWEQNATLVDPITGEAVEGRDQIAEYLKKKFETHKNGQLKIFIDGITFNSPDEAIVKSHFEIKHEDHTQLAGRILIENVKEDGKWYITRFSQFEQLPVSSQHEKLEKLDWLVGKWVDDSEDIEIASEWKWDKNKNFLTEHFTMKVLDEDAFNGFQIIGWDPAKEKIRSWIYDSDGGFGEGTWSQKDHSWYASMVFTLPDGRIGSSTNIYTKVDENTYTFSSVGRDIDGTVLPNVGPYEIVRKK